jgi:membrane-bound ClpP family serine protease
VALVVGILLAVFVVHGAWDYAVVAGGGVVELGESWLWWRWSRRRRAAVGVETLLGRVVDVDDDGWAHAAGERWRVRGAGPGEQARVVAVEGLTLVVEKSSEADV